MRLISRTALVALSATALAASVAAAPLASAEPEVTARQVEATFHEAEALNEQVNQLTENISKTQRQIGDLNADIARQQKLYDTQREALGATIAQQQMDSPLGTTVSLISSRDPQKFLDGLGAVQALNATRADALDEFTATAAELKNRREQLEQRKSEIAKDKKAAAKKQAAVKAKYNRAKAQLDAASEPVRRQVNQAPAVSQKPMKVKAPSGGAQTAVNFALAQIGDPYVYGGTGPDAWDCSGLVQGAWAAAGVSLPRVVGPQMAVTQRISRDQLQPGDLVAYASMSHIGMYIGNGQVVHASRPGVPVQITSLSGFSVFGRVG